MSSLVPIPDGRVCEYPRVGENGGNGRNRGGRGGVTTEVFFGFAKIDIPQRRETAFSKARAGRGDVWGSEGGRWQQPGYDQGGAVASDKDEQHRGRMEYV